MVGCQTVIAGKPRSHRGMRTADRSSVSSPRLLLICPPLGRLSGGVHPGTGAQRRSTQSNPLHAGASEANRRAMPPDECRSEGTPSLSEGPDARGETFASFGAFAKGSRCKSETISGRYRRNGYVHPERKWSAVRPSSRAGSLPQGNVVHLREIGRLSGRHRWQASSHSGMEYTRRTGQFLTRKPALIPLPHRHSRLPSTEKEKLSQSPQVEGPNNRHSTNRTNTPDNSISAKPTGKTPCAGLSL